MSLLSHRHAPVTAAALLTAAIPTWLCWPSLPLPSDEPVQTVTRVAVAAAPTLDAATKMPLFNPARSPPPTPEELAARAAAANAPPPPPPPPPPILVGTVLGGRAALALVRSTGAGTVVLHIGDQIDGWTLLGVGDRQATFVQGEERVTTAVDFSATGSASGRPPGTIPQLPTLDEPLPSTSPPGPSSSDPSGHPQ